MEATVKEEEVIENTEDTEEKKLTLDDLTIGYVVGLTADGNFVFDSFGKDKDLVGILGIHEHAKAKVTQLYEQSQMIGDALTNEVGKAVVDTNNKVAQLLNVVSPKKPDNKL